MRLNKMIAQSGVCSRRKAEAFIKEGCVAVNGIIEHDPARTINPGDIVTFDGCPLEKKREVYLLFNKPKGVTTTLRDRFAAKKVIDFIPKRFGRLYPVGRLDKQSRGLLILTNDGEFCHRVTHPRYNIEKEYLVWVDGKVNVSQLMKLKKGVKDARDWLSVKYAVIEKHLRTHTKVRVVVSEGKKRHLRRLFARNGLSVFDLQRIRIGTITLGRLKEGRYRIIEKAKMYKCIFNE
jgi:23S rRNA pseudouridine2605 synthase